MFAALWKTGDLLQMFKTLNKFKIIFKRNLQFMYARGRFNSFTEKNLEIDKAQSKSFWGRFSASSITKAKQNTTTKSIRLSLISDAMSDKM